MSGALGFGLVRELVQAIGVAHGAYRLRGARPRTCDVRQRGAAVAAHGETGAGRARSLARVSAGAGKCAATGATHVSEARAAMRGIVALEAAGEADCGRGHHSTSPLDRC